MLLLTALVLAITITPSDKPAPVLVYITSAGAKDGFTDPDKGSADTVKDLKRELKYRKSMVLTEDRARAALVVIVAGRETTGSIGLGRDRVIRVTLLYAQQEAELTASRAGGVMGSSGAWGDAAEKLVRQLDKWVKENRALLEQSTRAPMKSPQ